jgi:hypothetical protein
MAARTRAAGTSREASEPGRQEPHGRVNAVAGAAGERGDPLDRGLLYARAARAGAAGGGRRRLVTAGRRGVSG